MGTMTPPRFDADRTSTSTLRDALIDEDLENLDDEEVCHIVTDNWETFAPLFRAKLQTRYDDPETIWMEARDRGYLDPDYDPNN